MVIAYRYFLPILVSEATVVSTLTDDLDSKKNYSIAELKWVNLEVKRRFRCMSTDEESATDSNRSVAIN